MESGLIENYFLHDGEDEDMWCISFREYDKKGFLTELVSCKSDRIKQRRKSICGFLDACPSGMIREIQFRRGGKTYPSIVTDGQIRRFASPIMANLPLLNYAVNQGNGEKRQVVSG